MSFIKVVQRGIIKTKKIKIHQKIQLCSLIEAESLVLIFD